MSFLMFQVIFAALALGLLVVVVLIGKQIAAKRTPKTPEPTLDAQPKPPKPGLGKKAAVSEPEAPAAEAPMRRRQLQTFADAERSAVEAEAVVLPVAVADADVEADTAVVIEIASEPEFTVAEPDAEAEAPLVEPDTEPATSEVWVAEVPPPDEAGYNEEVLSRLEDAFEAFQSGELTLDAYRARVLAEEAEVQERIAALQDEGDDAELEAALAARDSVLWCLDWAEEQARAQG